MKLGGGIQDVKGLLVEEDPAFVDALYLLVERYSAAEQLSAVAADERPTPEMLEGYERRYPADPIDDAPWGELFPSLCLWLSDREYLRKEKQKAESDDRGHRSGDRSNISKYNFNR